MKLTMEPFCEENLPEITRIWNSVVEQGDSFPGDQILSLEEAREMFAAQTETVCVRLDGEVVGVYILHPNHIGRCSHVANASYGVKPGCRGAGIGRAMVLDSLHRAGKYGFRGLQFNAVVRTNVAAIHLYEQLGFTRVGVIPGGYRLKDGSYEDILIFYHPTV